MTPPAATTDSTETTYEFACALECGHTWTTESFTRLVSRIAWHWNEHHHDELRSTYTQIDEVERGGQHLHGNEYSVERIPIYITAFDVIDRLGHEDGFALPVDDADICADCLTSITDYTAAECLSEGPHFDRYRCGDCKAARDIKQKAARHHQLTDIAAQPHDQDDPH